MEYSALQILNVVTAYLACFNTKIQIMGQNETIASNYLFLNQCKRF